ncbi:predicted GPI-anchored protein 58 isoform X2 [Mastacembelus armatus]|uniref:predicted GPI-anchored protein 58 isoform X2 n=1 Tax=Mastacembelus armatus TaxID=205130 RepID=UPI000E460D3C|nr:predicted GPI-anchored protein 58 isoform X2 [Mastacembelus armatus]
MEDTLQQDKQLESKNPNEDPGGIRQRLRDRDLLRKRKAEAEEKETNQVETQRKRPRADDKSGTKRRGRPRKPEPTPEIGVIQEEAAVPQESPAVAVVPEPVVVISSGSLSPFTVVDGDTLVTQPEAVFTGPAPVLGSFQSPVFAPALSSPAPVNPTPALVSPSVPAPPPEKILDIAPLPALDAAAVAAQSQSPVPAPAPAAPTALPLVETLYTESQSEEALDQVLIEDLGPDEEEDISPSQDKRPDEDLAEKPSISIPEQNKMFSISTLSTTQEYLPGN